MQHFSSPQNAQYAAQAQAMRNQFIAKTLRSIFTMPSLRILPRISIKSRKSATPCVG